MKIFLTGATGFLGGRLAEKLRAENFAVKALVRPGNEDAFPEELGLELVEGDLRDESSVYDGMEGCEGVVHAAALVSSWEKDLGLFQSVNVEGTRKLFEISQRRHVKLVIYTSSFMALGPSNGRAVSESHKPEQRHFHNEYERSKTEALEIARSFQTQDLPLIILLPGMIYGPGAVTAGNYVVRMILDYLKGALPGMPGDGKSVWSYSYIDDVVDGHLHAIRRGRPGEDYILGGDNRSMADFFRALSEVSGSKPLARKVPLGVLKGYAWVQDVMADFFGRRPKLTAGEIEIFKHDWAYNSEKAIRRLGYSPLPLEEGLKRTLEWIEEAGIS